MGTKFVIKKIYNLGELLALAGEVKGGLIKEGDTGSTYNNKRFNVVKIETEYGEIPKADSLKKVTLIVKGLKRDDLAPQDTLYID